MQHAVVSRDEWKVARAALLAREKAHMRAGDALAAEQRALPWVKLEADYVFEGPGGKVTLSDLFDGRSQLFTKHFMLDAANPLQCTGCSLEADHVGGLLEHLNGNDVSYACISPAPLAAITAMRERMGWRFPWVSSLGTDYNRDIHVNFTPDGIAGSGNNIYYKDPDGQIFHTYAAYARGGENFLGIYRIFDLMPKGRGETGPNFSMADWVKPRDRYAEPGGVVSPDGRYHPPACGCDKHA